MPSFATLLVSLVGSFSVASGAVYFREQHRNSWTLTKKSGLATNVSVSDGDALRKIWAPSSHSPWAHRFGLASDASVNGSNVAQLVAVAVKYNQANNLTLGEGLIMARAHATGKLVDAKDAPLAGSNLLHTYAFTVALVTATVLFIYKDKGMQVISGILAYLFALATMKIVVKWVFAVNDFQYPIFLTGTHMLASALVGFAILAQRALQTGDSLVAPTYRELIFQFVPLAACIAGSIGASNISLVFCSASFAEIVSATTPIVTVGMVLIKGLPFDLRLLGPTIAVVLGCTLSVVGEVNFSLVGFLLCFVANILRAMKVVLQQELMTGETKAKFDPCATLAWMCTCSFAIIVVWSAASEGTAPYIRFLSEDGRFELVCAILASCVNAAILNLAALFVTKHLGAVGGQLVAQVKAVLTVLGGMAVFHESLSGQEVVGFMCVMVGTFAYSRTEQNIKREAAEKEVGKLPRGKA